MALSPTEVISIFTVLEEALMTQQLYIDQMLATVREAKMKSLIESIAPVPIETAVLLARKAGDPHD